MVDPFASSTPGLGSVATRHFAITPDNDADLPIRPRAIYCQADGDAVLRDEAGTDITYALVQGQIILFRAVRVLATGTTATLVGWV